MCNSSEPVKQYDLIDRRALLDDIEAAQRCGGMDVVVAGTLMLYIKRQPAATIESVRPGTWAWTGKWIWTENGKEDYEQYWVCSECGSKEYVKLNYGPNCGAKMMLYGYCCDGEVKS